MPFFAPSELAVEVVSEASVAVVEPLGLTVVVVVVVVVVVLVRAWRGMKLNVGFLRPAAT